MLMTHLNSYKGGDGLFVVCILEPKSFREKERKDEVRKGFVSSNAVSVTNLLLASRVLLLHITIATLQFGFPAPAEMETIFWGPH